MRTPAASAAAGCQTPGRDAESLAGHIPGVARTELGDLPGQAKNALARRW